MLNVDYIMKSLLSQALESDTFHISTTKLGDSAALATAFVVDQDSSLTPTSAQLLSNSSARTIAIVDRVADIDLAAKTIVSARFSFRGTSPYSPDLVLVNDFVKNEFIEACTKYAGKFFGSSTKATSSQSKGDSDTKKAFKTAEGAGEISTFGSNDFLVADVQER